MKKPRGSKAAPTAAPEAAVADIGRTRGWKSWRWIAIALGALLAVFEAYSGALHGPFLLDDLYLPFGLPDADRVALEMWLSRRPALMITFLFNYKLWGPEPYSYHVLNVLLHWLAGGLAFLLLRKLLEMAGEEGRKRDLLALTGAAVFLLHPIQTESVAYVASRSDVLCTVFVFASLAVFLRYRTPAIGLVPSLSALALFGLGVLSKEQAAVLPAIFLLTDVYWSKGSWRASIRANWKLYVPVIAGAAFGVAVILQTLRFADTAGFNVPGLKWWEYFLTQCRVIWLYLRLTVLPLGLNVDHDIPVSRGLFDHGAAFGLLALLAAVGVAWGLRRRYPLACYGLLTALLLLAPTSSFLPIKDVAAERRMYAPLLGLLMIGLDLLRRVKLDNAKLAAVAVMVAALGFATSARASLYGSDIAIWADSAEKSPRKVRPRFQLAYAYYKAGKCAEAEREFAHAARLDKPEITLLVDWALALDCLGKTEEAIAKLQEAVKLDEPGNAYAQLGMIYGRLGKSEEALAALDAAVKASPGMPMPYVYRGNVLGLRGEWGKAVEQYRRALELDPGNPSALQNLRVAEANLRQTR